MRGQSGDGKRQCQQRFAHHLTPFRQTGRQLPTLVKLSPTRYQSSLVRTSASPRSSSHLRTMAWCSSVHCRFPAGRSGLPGKITAAVKGQLIRLNHFINQIVNGLVDLLFAGSIRETPRDGKNPLPETRRYAFFLRRRRLRFVAIISPSRTLSHTPWPRRWPRCSNWLPGAIRARHIVVAFRPVTIPFKRGHHFQHMLGIVPSRSPYGRRRPASVYFSPVRQKAAERWRYYDALCATGQGKQLHHAQGVIGIISAALPPHRGHDAGSARPSSADARRGRRPASALQCRGNSAAASFRHRHQRSAHTETDLQRDRRLTAKQRGEIERRIVKFNAHHRPNIVQRVLLTFGQAALTTDGCEYGAADGRFHRIPEI